MILLFDADCRIPNPTALFDWYAKQFERGARVAYTRVDYYDLRPLGPCGRALSPITWHGGSRE